MRTLALPFAQILGILPGLIMMAVAWRYSYSNATQLRIQAQGKVPITTIILRDGEQRSLYKHTIQTSSLHLLGSIYFMCVLCFCLRMLATNRRMILDSLASCLLST